MSSHPLTVTELTRQLKETVEGNFPHVAVLGEVSNCVRASSGHVYFTLKDDAAQLRAVIWRGTASRLRFDLTDGLEVVAAGALEIYAARGTYQLIISELLPQGVGALELAFRQLQEKLEAEGLFDIERKKPLPRIPRRIALVTSPTGAAVRDMLQVITRRWRAADVVVVPVAVQGAGAAREIAAALDLVPKIPGVDVVIVGRGGGSLEDLWAFNEEPVARAISRCPLPVVSAVGHEIDVTIADLVADRRALTPSEAGEIVVPDGAEFVQHVDRLQQRLIGGLRQTAQRARMRLETIASRGVFARPLTRIHELAARLDDTGERLARAVQARIATERHRLSATSASLEALSPLKVLSRGYTITQDAETGEVIRSARQVQEGETITTRFADGRASSRVENVEIDEPNRIV